MARPETHRFERAILRRAAADAVRKLHPLPMARNPVMFVVYLGSLLTTGLAIQALGGHGEADPGFILAVAVWLWFTVLFGNFAEALAEGRGKAQAASLRGTRTGTMARKLAAPSRDARFSFVPSTSLRRGDHVLVEAGELIPGDGEVIEGLASVNEAAVTGESAPVIRASGGDFSAVTGGTLLLSDWLLLRITADPGESFLDRMIGLVEGARRRRTPNELALAILLAGLSLVFLVVSGSLLPFSMFAVEQAGHGTPVPLTMLVALLVCLIPTTIGGLLSAIGIAGMDRMIQARVIATSGRAIEAAGDVDVLLLDKTGTITLGHREATALRPAPGVAEPALAEAALLASWADETPEGRSIVRFVQQQYALQAPALTGAHFVPFSAQARMSGVDLGTRSVRKGASTAVHAWVQSLGGAVPDELQREVETIARQGATPLLVADGARALGVISLQDVLKPGIRERFGELRSMGIRTVMITGDNALTAAAVAAEAGVDDFLAEATPEAKLQRIRDYQAEGRLVAMTGDGTNDAPALAQADVAVAMHAGTQAAKEAANLVDLDSDPTKLIETVGIGKQLLMTRGALTTFSFANDIAKYFAILPAIFAGAYAADGGEGPLAALDPMALHSPQSAILSAVIFNALIIVALVPLALRGVRYRPGSAASTLRRHLLVYGLGGLAAPFIGIKLIDLGLVALGLA